MKEKNSLSFDPKNGFITLPSSLSIRDGLKLGAGLAGIVGATTAAKALEIVGVYWTELSNGNFALDVEYRNNNSGITYDSLVANSNNPFRSLAEQISAINPSQGTADQILSGWDFTLLGSPDADINQGWYWNASTDSLQNVGGFGGFDYELFSSPFTSIVRTIVDPSQFTGYQGSIMSGDEWSAIAYSGTNSFTDYSNQNISLSSIPEPVTTALAIGGAGFAIAYNKSDNFRNQVNELWEKGHETKVPLPEGIEKALAYDVPITKTLKKVPLLGKMTETKPYQAVSKAVNSVADYFN